MGLALNGLNNPKFVGIEVKKETKKPKEWFDQTDILMLYFEMALRKSVKMYSTTYDCWVEGIIKKKEWTDIGKV